MTIVKHIVIGFGIAVAGLVWMYLSVLSTMAWGAFFGWDHFVQDRSWLTLTLMIPNLVTLISLLYGVGSWANEIYEEKG